MAGVLRVRVLGPVRMLVDETEVDVGGGRHQAVLVGLALRAGVTVGKQELADGVWGSERPGNGSPDVAGYVYRLRQSLKAGGVADPKRVIASDSVGYRFVADAEIDTARMEQVAAEADGRRRAGDLTAAADRYSGALELYRGEPLAGLPGPYAEGQRQRLAARRIALWQQRYECLLALGHHEQVVAELTELTARPDGDRLAALLIRALYASGRRVDALAAFEVTRQRLATELDALPDKELRRAHEAVQRDDAAALGLAPRHPVPRQLPADGEVVGHARDLARLTAPGPRVLAVDGMAGVGKTTLAVAAAWRTQARYPDGTLFLNLRGHAEGRRPLEPRRALRQLLRALGADDERAEDLDELAAAWRSATASRSLLLVLDDAVSAGQVRPLLPAGAASRVLVTSRTLLVGLDADERICLRPLTLDESARLLAGIVGDERTGQRAAVRELARLCGQLPLALRIAGARLQSRPSWTVRDLAERLAADEARLGELTAEDRSVQAAFRLSYDQLPAESRAAFRVLGLAPTTELDRLTLAAMLDVPPARAEAALESLVDASLLQQPAAGRYRLHDLVAVYARRLAADEPTPVDAARTGAYRLYVAAARAASDRGPTTFPTGPSDPVGAAPFADRGTAVGWLDAASGEVVDVVTHAARSGYPEYACWIAEALVDYLTRQGRYQECYQAIDAALPLADGIPDRRMASSLRIALGDTLSLQGHFERGLVPLGEALEIARRTADPREQARARRGLGEAASYLGEYTEATAHLTALAELADRLEDDWLAGNAMYHLGVVHHRIGNRGRASEFFAAAVPLVDKAGDDRLAAGLACLYGDLRIEYGEYAEAAAMLRQAVERAERIGDMPLRGFVLTRLGTAEERLGRDEAAVALHTEALAAVTDQTSVELEMEVRVRLGYTHLAAGRIAEARDQFHRVLPLTETDRRPERLARALALDGLRRCDDAEGRRRG